jgi:hypothetical protein
MALAKQTTLYTLDSIEPKIESLPNDFRNSAIVLVFKISKNKITPSGVSFVHNQCILYRADKNSQVRVSWEHHVLSKTKDWRDNIRSKKEEVLIPWYMPNASQSQLLGPRRFSDDREQHLLLFFIESHGICLSNMWHTPELVQIFFFLLMPKFSNEKYDSAGPGQIQHSIS